MEMYFLFGAVAAVVIARRFSRIVGGIIGMVVAIAVGVWGMMTFAKGAGIAFAGFPISREAFLGLSAAWFLFESWGFWGALKARRASGD